MTKRRLSTQILVSQISILVVIITSILLRSLAGGFLVLLPLATAALSTSA